MDEVRGKLSEELGTVDWRALRAHTRRDCMILVAPELDLLEVAWCVAKDCAAEVSGWIADGRLRKPGAEELAAWERETEKPFRVLVVAPYVLIQPV